ncbi:hypothetical protein SETIT_3G361600v2 [Setaria italica]|uniref:Uncharacterized protein n=1 Tax=Setaria italica TaxID=4555 RepID=A0A368QME9_SETIT|nr:hypothetical protein SETIT_3G361600v2 [Setaria italica]
MRSVVRSLRQLRRFIWRHAESHPSTTRLIRQQNALIMFASPGVDLVRSMFSTAAADSIRGQFLISLYMWCLLCSLWGHLNQLNYMHY